MNHRKYQILALTLTGIVGASPTLAAPPSAPVKQLPFAAGELPTQIKPRAALLSGLRWQDRQGDNWVVFSRRRLQTRAAVGDHDPEHAAYLYAQHVLRPRGGGAPRLVREVKDLVQGCEFDLTAEFLDKSLGVTDLDRDGVGEATFAYKQGCRSDVSPITLKLLLLEGGAKYILRGSTSVRVSDTEQMGGTHTVDPSFKKGPPAFLQHARRVWQAVAREF